MTGVVTLRDARPDDAPAITELVKSLPEWFTPDVVEKAPADAARLPARVAVDENGVLIGLVVWKVDGAEAEIKWIMVAPGSHRQGIGRKLVEDLLPPVREAGATRLVVNTVAPTVDCEPYARTRCFYEAMGFVLDRCEPAGWPDGTDKGTYVMALGGADDC